MSEFKKGDKVFCTQRWDSGGITLEIIAGKNGSNYYIRGGTLVGNEVNASDCHATYTEALEVAMQKKADRIEGIQEEINSLKQELAETKSIRFKKPGCQVSNIVDNGKR